jgi:Double zinc ribbon
MPDVSSPCPHEYQYMADGSLYCQRCGSNVNALGHALPPMPKFCVACSSPMNPESPICTHCGTLSESMVQRGEMLAMAAPGAAAATAGSEDAWAPSSSYGQQRHRAGGPPGAGAGVRARSPLFWRRTIIVVILASLALSTLIGVLLLITGQFSGAALNIASVIGAITEFGLFALVSYTLIERRKYEKVGWTGLVVVGLAFLGVLIVTIGSGVASSAAKVIGVFIIGSVSFTQASLLLLVRQRHERVRIACYVTIGVIALMAVILIYPVARNFEGINLGYLKLLGAVFLLDIAGTIATPLLSRFSSESLEAEA